MYLCVDVGGTKTLVALVDGGGGIVRSVRFGTDADQGRFLEILAGEIRSGGFLDGVKVIAVAIAGPVEDNRVLWLGNLPWKDFDIAGALGAEFGLPVWVENDANLAGLAEAADFEGLSVYLTFSTGVGGGVVLDGKLEGSRRIYEPGHDKYMWDGSLMEWEDIASARAVRAHFGKLTSEIEADGDWQEVAGRVAMGLHSVISVIRPRRIIFGGHLGLCLEKYRGYLEDELRRELSPGTELPELMVARLGNKSVIYGCYLYARDHSVD